MRFGPRGRPWVFVLEASGQTARAGDRGKKGASGGEIATTGQGGGHARQAGRKGARGVCQAHGEPLRGCEGQGRASSRSWAVYEGSVQEEAEVGRPSIGKVTLRSGKAALGQPAPERAVRLRQPDGGDDEQHWRAEPVDAGVGPEVDEDVLAAQVRRLDRRRVQPAGRPVEPGRRPSTGMSVASRIDSMA